MQILGSACLQPTEASLNTKRVTTKTQPKHRKTPDAIHTDTEALYFAATEAQTALPSTAFSPLLADTFRKFDRDWDDAKVLLGIVPMRM